jgi:hypothetical protein
MSHWRPLQAFYLEAMGFERWTLRPAPAPLALVSTATAIATPAAAVDSVGYRYSGPQAPSWMVVALSDAAPAFFSSTLGSSIAFALGLNAHEIGFLQPARGETIAAAPALQALAGTICLGATAQAWLLQQAQAQPLGLEAALSIQSLQVWPTPEEIVTPAGKQALWREWTLQARP